MSAIGNFARKIGLLPDVDASKPLIDPVVDHAINTATAAADELRNRLKGQAAIDQMLHNTLGPNHYFPSGG